jgi:hypothetical protein
MSDYLLALLLKPVEGRLAALIALHPHLAAVLIVILPGMATVVNTMLKIKPLAAWVADAERSPVIKHLADISAKAGLDPVPTLQSLGRLSLAIMVAILPTPKPPKAP